ncbi:hypothetical protein JCM3765_003902 [Sporobolomyces pararoseus]
MPSPSSFNSPSSSFSSQPSTSRTSSTHQPSSSPTLPQPPRLPPQAHFANSPPLLSTSNRKPSISISSDSASSISLSSPSGPIEQLTKEVERRRSSQEEGRTSRSAPKQETTTTRQRGASVSQLSWGSWWPFQVVSPEPESEGDGPPTPPRKDETGEDSILSLFAGKKSVDAARQDRQAIEDRDNVEAELLDTDLETLRRLSVSTSESIPREADDSPFRPTATAKNDKSLPPTPARSTSSFPSLFSANSSRTGETSSSTSPKSLLSSFTLPNPFSSASPSDIRPRVARHYSTSRHPTAEEGPTAKKGQVEDMVDEADKEAVEEEAEENAEIFSILKDRYRAPKLPIVFCHGLFGFDHLGPTSIKPLQFSYWVGVQEALEAMGVEVLIGRVPASASIEERAKVLCEMIGERFPGREVNLIGHSMGGLDGRFLISRLQPTNFKVKSLTTISTPHRGSSFADYLLEDVLGTSRVPMLLSFFQTLGVPGGGKAFDDLTTTKMARFNLETPDKPDVRYFSYGAEFSPSWSNVFRVPWNVVQEREGANDGLVSVESAKWGEYQATLHNVNHLDLIGMVGKVRYGWASWIGSPIKFRPISFFCALAEKLADEGF